MSGFRDLTAANRSMDRVGLLTSRDVRPFLISAAESSSNPDAAISHFERWIAATSTPATYFDLILAAPELGRIFVSLLAASHQLSTVLVQNPEIATLIFDIEMLKVIPDKQEMRAELDVILANANSYSHALDRLRYYKQSWHLRIATADLIGVWREEQVWCALSTVADTLIATTAQVVWKEIGHYESECPVAIVAMGKLGGQELNFSSDIDLVYILSDEASDEKCAIKFAETLTRALSNRMGRGALYRVDLRLRPYGARGELAPHMHSIVSYYENYAESWEQLAMLRSRAVFGPEEVASRWSALREKVCFRSSRGEWFVQEIVDMRSRIDAQVDSDDIKRSSGGIRDVEFIAQVLQSLYGASKDVNGVLSTCEAIRKLFEVDVISKPTAQELIESYTFLRQVEHRIQLLGELQSHNIPSSIEERTTLSRRLGFQNVNLFDSTLALNRARIRETYSQILLPINRDKRTSRTRVLESISLYANLVAAWIDALPSSDLFYESLAENESSLRRVEAITLKAPALIPFLQQSVVTTEQVLSGEILEQNCQPEFTGKPDLATAIKRTWLRSGIYWTIKKDFDYGKTLSQSMDSVLFSILGDLEVPLTLVALGSYGSTDLLPFSDLDILLIRPENANAELAEKCAQKFLSIIQASRVKGAPIEVDLRLRPDGRKGSLTISEEGFKQYESTSMEPWERLAMGRARGVNGELPNVIMNAAYSLQFDEVTKDLLCKMKGRIERERIPAQFRSSQIKLGHGGQDDIIWLVQLLTWKYNTLLVGINAISISDRLEHLKANGLLEIESTATLKQAWSFYSWLRISLAFAGRNDETIPDDVDLCLHNVGTKENYQRISKDVRRIFQDTISKL